MDGPVLHEAIIDQLQLVDELDEESGAALTRKITAERVIRDQRAKSED